MGDTEAFGRSRVAMICEGRVNRLFRRNSRGVGVSCRMSVVGCQEAARKMVSCRLWWAISLKSWISFINNFMESRELDYEVSVSNQVAVVNTQ